MPNENYTFKSLTDKKTARYHSSNTGQDMVVEDFRKGPESGLSLNVGRGAASPEFPPEGKAQPAHMGSQSGAPGKEDPIGERGSGYSSY